MSSAAPFRQMLDADCPKQIKFVSSIYLIALVFSVILFILMIAVAIYNYSQNKQSQPNANNTPATGTTTDPTAQAPSSTSKKIIAIINYGAITVSGILALINMYGFISINKTAKKCTN